MSTNVPGAVDATLSIDGAVDTLDSEAHDDLHENHRDATNALLGKVGTGASTPAANHALIGTGSGTSEWKTASATRTALGLVIGTDVQAFATEPVFDGVKLPSSPGVADGNVLDAYVEGAWTPVVTFATPGDLAISAYTQQVGYYERVGRLVFWRCAIQIAAAAMTWTTASGNLRITGLPVACVAGTGLGYTSATIRGWTKANFTQTAISPVSAQSYLETLASGSGQVPTALTAAEFTTAAAFNLFASGQYRV